MVPALFARKASDADAHLFELQASGDLLITLSRVGSFRAGRLETHMRKLFSLLCSRSCCWIDSELIRRKYAAAGGGEYVQCAAVADVYLYRRSELRIIADSKRFSKSRRINPSIEVVTAANFAGGTIS
jgi:hypothetical protein